MDNYSKIYSKELERQMKEISDSIKLSSSMTRQAEVLSQAIRDSELINIQRQTSKIVDALQIPKTKYENYISAQIGEIFKTSLEHNSVSIGMEEINNYMRFYDIFKSQFDFLKYTQDAFNQWSHELKEFDNNLESVTKGLFETLEAVSSCMSNKKHDNDSSQKYESNQIDDVKISYEGHALSKEEIDKTCTTIHTIIYYPDTASQHIGMERQYYEDHPIVCGIIIGVIAAIISSLILAKILSKPSQDKVVVTKNINATVKESFDEPQKEKIKLPPCTSVIIVDETTPRYYEVEYTDPETGERKCGYVAKQCVIKNENVHGERVGD